MTQLIEEMKRGGSTGPSLSRIANQSLNLFEAFANPSFSDFGSVSVPGLNWDTRDATFSVSRGVSIDLAAKLTQRKHLSSVSAVYDPLGLVVPFTIRGRLIVKEL